MSKNQGYLNGKSFTNAKKRPDLIVIGDSTLSITGVSSFDKDGELSAVDKILVIELKKGGFKIKRDERDQANGYLEELLFSGSLPILNLWIPPRSVLPI